MIWVITQLVLIVLLPISQVVWGRELTRRFLPSERELPLAFNFFTGLLAQLFFVLLCGSLFFGTSAGQTLGAANYKYFWMLVTTPLLAPLLLKRPEILHTLRAILFQPLSINACLWFAVTLVLGITQFESANTISTIWINNYSDLTFHLGMIFGFLIGGNYPPEYQVYAGETLSYPFFINLWSALLAWPGSNVTPMPVIFLFQWMVLWSVIFRVLEHQRLFLLPWAVLLGGGTWPYLLRYISDPAAASAHLLSHDFIDKGEPWSVFLSTLWVTQRSFLFGIAILLVALQNFHNLKLSPWTRVLASTSLLSLGVLAHTHTMLVGLLYIGLLATRQSGVGSAFALGILPSLLSVPFIWGKRSIIEWIPGWKSPDAFSAIAMWLLNAPALLLGMVVLLCSRKTRPVGAAIALLFLCGNIVQLAVWDWDQIKVFVVLYVIMLFSLHSVTPTDRFAKLLQLLLLIAVVPGAVECWRVLSDWKVYTVYSPDLLRQAVSIEARTPLGAVIVGKPVHNSPVTLAGRSLFCGYAGTLYSHGIDYRKREQLNYKALSGETDNLREYLKSTPLLELRPTFMDDVKLCPMGKTASDCD